MGDVVSSITNIDGSLEANKDMKQVIDDNSLLSSNWVQSGGQAEQRRDIFSLYCRIFEQHPT